MAQQQTLLEEVKKAIGAGDAQDDALTVWIATVQSYLTGAGVPESKQTAGIVARGVEDIWNYGAGNGQFSPLFMHMASQLALRN